MNSRLAVRLKGGYLALRPDTSIEIVDTNPYFNDVTETQTYSFEIPIEGNRDLLGNVDDLFSDGRLVEHENNEMSIIIDGIPFRNGKVATTESQEIKSNVSISMTSNIRSLSEYISKLKCQDIPVKDKIQIGEMIGNVTATFSAKMSFRAKLDGTNNDIKNTWYRYKKDLDHYKGDVTLELPALGFSYPAICYEDANHYSNGCNNEDGSAEGKSPDIVQSFANVTEEYPNKAYCNARVCYMHYKLNEDGTSSDVPDDSNPGDDVFSFYNPYLMLEADRPQSGICFYILYFLDCLFAYLKDYGISYDNSGLMGVPDMRRLVFFTTLCKYDLERKYDRDIRDSNGNITKYVFDYNNLSSINRWLYTRGTGGKLELKAEDTKKLEGLVYKGEYVTVGDKIKGKKIRRIEVKMSNLETDIRANIMNMYANSKNFPTSSVQDVIDSLWASFGIRFYLDQETRIVKPRFIRDIFRDNTTPIVLNCKLIGDPVKKSEKITGFRMKYSAESDVTEQRNNVANGVRDYNTEYDYIDYSRIEKGLTYLDIIQKCSVSDMTLYLDMTTGNRYRLKVNKDATDAKEMRPTIFEVGQFKGVEIGDCSEEMEDYIEVCSSYFTPLSFNDINGRREKAIGNNNNGTVNTVDEDTGEQVQLSSVNASLKEQVLAAFISEDMWHEYCERRVQTAFGDDYSNIYIVESCKTREAFDPENSEEGCSPLQEMDWEMTIAVMRGGGSNATIEYYDYDYDGFGSSKWRTKAGLYGMSSDSIDAWGATYDYNANLPGIGDEERFSLKIRAYITDPKTGEILCDSKVANRGLYDQFMSEYARFILDRKPIVIPVSCSVSELTKIEWDKRYNICGFIGFINKITTVVSVSNGIEKVNIEMFVI